MTDKHGDSSFISRWSKRKVDARGVAGVEVGESRLVSVPGAPEESSRGKAFVDGEHAGSLPVTGVSQTAQSNARDALPPVESLTFESDFRPFGNPGVDSKIRNQAMKVLFKDPHFNVMDGLDTYIDDYSKPDPIPEAMLRSLNQAKSLMLFDDETKEGGLPEEGETTRPENNLPAPAVTSDLDQNVQDAAKNTNQSNDKLKVP